LNCQGSGIATTNASQALVLLVLPSTLNVQAEDPLKR
jgi:hypothetical protein